MGSSPTAPTNATASPSHPQQDFIVIRLGDERPMIRTCLAYGEKKRVKVLKGNFMAKQPDGIGWPDKAMSNFRGQITRLLS